MHTTLLRRPSALAPVAMSATALAIVIGYLFLYGPARQEDEGAAARVFQLLMVGQLPLMAYFALRWLPVEPRRTLLILALQISAALAALAPIVWYEW